VRTLLISRASLECGDVFCLSCITEHMDGIRRSFGQRTDSRPVPPDLLQALRKPLADLRKYFEAVRYCKEHPGPEYSCPACSTLLKHRPVKVFDRKALEQTFGLLGTPAEEHEADLGKGTDEPLFVDCSLL